MKTMNRFDKELTQALSKMLAKTILSADYQERPLKGGTLGDLALITGSAKCMDGTDELFAIVRKKQKKWERYGDPLSWHREYDLYTADFGLEYSDRLHIPECYHSSFSEDEMILYIEYIVGVSGRNLTTEMLMQTVEELGSWQGKLYTHPEMQKKLSCFTDTGFFERDYQQWHTGTYTYEYLCSDSCWIPNHVRQMLRSNPQWDYNKSIEYCYLRSKENDMPNHLKQMLIDIDDNRETLFQEIKRLPVVLCHRDLWIENIFYQDEKIVLIDWDVTGLGYLGEDLASLIIDETEPDKLHEYFDQLIPAYCRGVSKYMNIPQIQKTTIWEMILLKFGYRIMQGYFYGTSEEEKAESVKLLQKLYELKDNEKES